MLADADSLTDISHVETVVRVEQTPQHGQVLTDNAGMTLYAYEKDTPKASACQSGRCAERWPAVRVPMGVIPQAAPGVPGTLGIIELSDGTNQVTYNGRPLYRFSGDKQPGDVNGNGLLHLWSVVHPAPTATHAAAGQPAVKAP